ncbi:hypothetical protein [Nonomuraea sp. NPDC049141]|uniref:hypothetical protein n=1 Tax=Nonomuraea sp. NPDC049141 TaxID=3155500 RepID=UPI0033F3904E
MSEPTVSVEETPERPANPPGRLWAIGFAFVYLDPRGLHEFGYLLTDAATIARGGA